MSLYELMYTYIVERHDIFSDFLIKVHRRIYEGFDRFQEVW